MTKPFPVFAEEHADKLLETKRNQRFLFFELAAKANSKGCFEPPMTSRPISGGGDFTVETVYVANIHLNVLALAESGPGGQKKTCPLVVSSPSICFWTSCSES